MCVQYIYLCNKYVHNISYIYIHINIYLSIYVFVIALPHSSNTPTVMSSLGTLIFGF